MNSSLLFYACHNIRLSQNTQVTKQAAVLSETVYHTTDVTIKVVVQKSVSETIILREKEGGGGCIPQSIEPPSCPAK